MFSSKVIKILCYVVTCFICAISIALFVVGVCQVIDKNNFGVFFIITSLLLPFLCTVSLYPMFALANIDKNINILNEKVEEFINSCKKEKMTFSDVFANDLNSNIENRNKSFDEAKYLNQYEKSTILEAIDFICERYEISISFDDDIYTLKEKILSIKSNSTRSSILKSKIKKSETKEEILNIFVTHKVAYK